MLLVFWLVEPSIHALENFFCQQILGLYLWQTAHHRVETTDLSSSSMLALNQVEDWWSHSLTRCHWRKVSFDTCLFACFAVEPLLDPCLLLLVAMFYTFNWMVLRWLHQNVICTWWVLTGQGELLATTTHTNNILCIHDSKNNKDAGCISAAISAYIVSGVSSLSSQLLAQLRLWLSSWTNKVDK